MRKIQILLSTYNGEKYIKEQIESILNQEEVEVSLLIRDDGSTDNTTEIIKELVQKNQNITFYQEENKGPAKSFMDLIKKSKETQYYAFADQDDVWMPKKLISAIQFLEKEKNKPALYLSALEIVDEKLNKIKTQKVIGNFSFEGAIIKNFATGCTQVWNKEFQDILKKYEPSYILMHDSWITRVCYAIGGKVIIDDKSYIKYRQHDSNVVGYKEKKIQKLKKQLKIAFKDHVCMRVNMAKELKKGYEPMLTQEAKELINNLISYPKNKEAKKWLLHNKKFRTIRTSINAKMKLAILLNRF